MISLGGDGGDAPVAVTKAPSRLQWWTRSSFCLGLTSTSMTVGSASAVAQSRSSKWLSAEPVTAADAGSTASRVVQSRSTICAVGPTPGRMRRRVGLAISGRALSLRTTAWLGRISPIC